MDNISALMDGELEDYNASAALQSLKSRDDLRDQWLNFHVIGDALRQDAQLSYSVAAKFRERLTREPTVLAPRRASAMPRKMALSAAASVAAVAMVGWLALGENPLRPADNVATPTSREVAHIEIDPTNATVNDYLLAHQEFSPSSAIQGFAPYVRTVSETR